jgi:diguanylate cyclase (GGDEF)-like protein
MPKYSGDYWKVNFPGKKIPLRYRLQIIFFIEAYLLAILSAITNMLLGIAGWGMALLWLYIAFCTLMLVFARDDILRISRLILLFATFLYLPLLYFQTGGFDGIALIFALLGILLLAVVFRGRKSYLLIAANVLLCIACVLANWLYPQLVTPLPAANAGMANLLLALLLASLALMMMTAHISNAYQLEQSRLRQQLEQAAKSNASLEDLTNRDALTGVYNRRYLSWFLEQGLDPLYGKGRSICLLMMDLDFFKKINDAYGHSFGDEALVSFVKTVELCLRSYDIIARYGGEEFVVVLPDLDLAAAERIAERIRLAVSNISLRPKMRLTVSIGLAASRKNEDAADLISRADRCLYQAKRQGRNLVISERQAEAEERSRKVEDGRRKIEAGG